MTSKQQIRIFVGSTCAEIVKEIQEWMTDEEDRGYEVKVRSTGLSETRTTTKMVVFYTIEPMEEKKYESWM